MIKVNRASTVLTIHNTFTVHGLKPPDKSGKFVLKRNLIEFQ